MPAFPFKPMLAIVTLIGMVAAFPRVSHDLRTIDRATVQAVFDFPPEPLAPGEIQDNSAPAVAEARLVDPSGDLSRFYSALDRTERHEPNAITRIVHYGDSPTTADLITGDIRLLLQRRFGDAGHGFSLVAKPWAWYEHRDVGLRGRGWSIMAASMPGKNDGLFGLGGVSFQSSAGSSRLALRDPGHTGAEVSYLQQPGGGSFSVSADGVELGSVPTESAERTAGFAHFRLPAAGARTIEIQAHGAVRLFGIVLEKPGPGITYDSLGMNGAHVALLAHNFNEAHWAAQLQHRRPDLVVLNYGTNESGFASFVGGTYEKELRLAVKRLRRALPEVSLLLMSPMDRAERVAGGEIKTLATIPKIVAIQERVARETGCAFFNTFAAMGGEGTMARWYEAHPRMVSADFIHPSPGGAKLVGNQLYLALSDGFTKYKLKRMREKYKVAGAKRAAPFKNQ
jgi:lysophospholipase L1-like esterase